MSRTKNKGNGHKGGSTVGTDISKSQDHAYPKIPQPFTIRKESTSEENQQYDEERNDRQSQLNTAQRLNRISLVGVVVALLSLVAVYLGLLQNRSTFKRGERAWVMVEEFRFVDPFSTTANASIYTSIKNVGKSPALQVTVHKHSTLGGGRCVTKYNPPPYKASTLDLGPGQTHPLTSPVISAIAQECIDDLNSGVATYRLEGTVTYKDEFGDSRESGFCGMYAGLLTHDILPCDEGNYTH
jgi:hypothetical protein